MNFWLLCHENVKVPVLHVCRTVIRVDNSSGMLANEAFSSKSKFIKSASTYFDNDDNNLETLKWKKRIELGFEVAIFGFGGRRANRCAILPCFLFRKRNTFIDALLLLSIDKRDMFIINTSSISHMTRVTWQNTQINITQWHNKLVCKFEGFKRIEF